ncbi:MULTISPECIES: acyltransferase domain-containing protein, partial [Amycolatopsis]|uniref:acyltransferase domain-containing protein n=1 Tax=Amycolatopsis TaxID=1813 RepID=UPI00174867CE
MAAQETAQEELRAVVGVSPVSAGTGDTFWRRIARWAPPWADRDVSGTFDRELFGLSGRQAGALTAEQRLLLELCWEALEDAGVPGGRVVVAIDAGWDARARVLVRTALTAIVRGLDPAAVTIAPGAGLPVPVAGEVVLAGSAAGDDTGVAVVKPVAGLAAGDRVRCLLRDGTVLPPPAEPAGDGQPGPAHTAAVPLVVSSTGPAALREDAAELRSFLAARPETSLTDLGWTLATRAGLPHRAVLLADDHAAATGLLDVLAVGGTAANLIGGHAPARAGDVVFVFPGQGPQWAGMAGELLDTSPAFARKIDACAAALEPFVEWSLTDVLRGVAGAPSLERVDVVQPALFAVMVSLAEVWRAHGVRPAAVVGHSLGEIAAAHVAGALSLDDAARVVAVWSLLQAELRGRGDMASIPLPEDETARLLAGSGGRACVAAVNGPRQVVVSGDSDVIAGLLADLAGRAVEGKLLPVGLAAHSPHIDEIVPRLAAALASLAPRPPEIPLYSTVTGRPLGTRPMDAGYWCANLRQPVRFAEVVATLAATEAPCFVEVSPNPVLTMGMQQTFDEVAPAATAMGTLRRGHGGLRQFRTAAAELHVRGVPVDWAAAFRDSRPRRVELPRYAFRRTECPAVEPAEPHALVWRPGPGAGAGALTGTWLVVRPAGTHADAAAGIAAALEARGAAEVRLSEWPGPVPPPGLSGVVSLLPLGSEGDGSTATAGLQRSCPGARLWSVTRSGVVTGSGDAAAAAIWGTAHSPGPAAVVDLDRLDTGAYAALAELVAAGSSGAVRGPAVLVPAWEPVAAPSAPLPEGTLFVLGHSAIPFGRPVVTLDPAAGPEHLAAAIGSAEGAPVALVVPVPPAPDGPVPAGLVASTVDTAVAAAAIPVTVPLVFVVAPGAAGEPGLA